MCRSVLEMLPLFGVVPEDLQPSSPKYLLSKDVEKTFDLFDRYRLYASTGRLRETLAHLQALNGARDLSDTEFDQQTRFGFVLQMTDPTKGPSAAEVVKQAHHAAAETAGAGVTTHAGREPAPEPAAAAADDEEEQDFSSEEEWDAFQAPPLPEPGQAEIVPPGMTAGGLARRRASLAPQVGPGCMRLPLPFLSLSLSVSLSLCLSVSLFAVHVHVLELCRLTSHGILREHCLHSPSCQKWTTCSTRR